jgi:uncharacterized protein YrrD
MNVRDIMAKPVVAIRLGKSIGKIRYPIIDSHKQEVIGFIIDDAQWYLETKVILFPLIRGMGNDVVTVEDESAIMSVSNLKAIQRQLEENVQIIGHKVITETGSVLGTIEEFSFHQLSGKIEHYRVKESGLVFYHHDVLSIGSQLVIIKEQAAMPLQQTSERPAHLSDHLNLNSIFEKRQMEFVIGKRLSRTLASDEGLLIAREGDLISEDVIVRAKNKGKFTELVMSIDHQDGIDIG